MNLCRVAQVFARRQQRTLVDASIDLCCITQVCTPSALLCKHWCGLFKRYSKLRVSSKGWRGNSKLVRSTKCSRMQENEAANFWEMARLISTRTFEIRPTPLLTARRPPLDAEKHAFRAFAGGRISQKKIKARFESVVCSTAILGVGSTRLHPSSSDATLPARTHAWCKTGCPAPAVAAFPPGEP